MKKVAVISKHLGWREGKDEKNSLQSYPLYPDIGAIFKKKPSVI